MSIIKIKLKFLLDKIPTLNSNNVSLLIINHEKIKNIKCIPIRNLPHKKNTIAFHSIIPQIIILNKL